MQAAEYDEPDAEGRQGCPRHPHVPRFFADKADCPDCLSDPEAENDEPGEGERLCAEAEARGLPDAMTVEDRFWVAWAFQTRRAESCARRADALYETEDPDDLDRAIKLEAAAAKWADSSTKAGKIASQSVLHRNRMAELERRARRHKLTDGNKTEAH